MFTGLIQATGRVVARRATPEGVRLEVRAEVPSAATPFVVAHGDSVSVDGCCLTLAGRAPDGTMQFDVIHQTLQMTTLGELGLQQRVNLEPAATPSTALGGHIVQGHVDGVGVVRSIDRGEGQWRLRIDAPERLLDAVLEQGSISVSGVSLTVAARTGDTFDVALIPTTLELTNLGELKVGDRVNLETDYLARIVINWLNRHGMPKR